MRKAARARRGPRRTREQWSALLEQYRDSKLTQTAFCSSRDLAVSSFTSALRRAREEHVDVRSADTFVPLVLSNTVEEAQASAWDVELTLGAGIVLRIRGM